MSRRHAGLCLLTALMLSVALRWPGLTQGRIANHDVAGILYEGMVLRAGGLPYVDTIELKAPGTFYLAWWIADGTDIAGFQVAAGLVALASLAGIAAIAWQLWGPRPAVVAAALYLLHDAHLDTMDANYITWAQLPMILAALASARGRVSERAWPWLLAGLAAGLALLCKRPVGLVAVGLSLAATKGKPRGLAWVLGGALLAHLPIALHYAAHGQTSALLHGYLLSERGLAYAGFGTRNLAAQAWREGPLAALYFIPLPLLVATLAWLAPSEAHDEPADRRWLTVWAMLALAAASIGFRFYKGYFLAAVAPLCLLGAAPWSLFGTRPWPWLARLGAAALVAVLIVRQGMVLHAERVNRAYKHDEGGRIIARHVRAHSPQGATVWIWGWHLWDVYPYTGMLSGSRLYKSVNIITTGNDATWRAPRSPMHFVDGPMAELLLRDLERNRPHYIVLGSSVPRHEFTALRRFLVRHYRLDTRVRLGRVQFWVLRS